PGLRDVPEGLPGRRCEQDSAVLGPSENPAILTEPGKLPDTATPASHQAHLGGSRSGRSKRYEVAAHIQDRRRQGLKPFGFAMSASAESGSFPNGAVARKENRISIDRRIR